MFELLLTSPVITNDKIQASDKIIKIISTSPQSQGGLRIVGMHESGAILVLEPKVEQLEEVWFLKPDIADKQPKHPQLSFYNSELRFAVISKNLIKTFDIELGDKVNDSYPVNIKHHPIACVEIPFTRNIIIVDKEGMHVFNSVYKNIQTLAKVNIQQLLWLDESNLLTASSLEADQPVFKIWDYATIVNGVKEPVIEHPSSRGSMRGRLGSEASNSLTFKPQLIKIAKNKIATTHPKGIKLWRIDGEKVLFEKLIQIPGVNQLMLVSEQYLLSTTPEQTIIWNIQDDQAIYRSETVLQQVISLHNHPNHYVCVDKDGKLMQLKIQRKDLSATSHPVVNSNLYATRSSPSTNNLNDKQTSISSGTVSSTSISTFDGLDDEKNMKKNTKCCNIL